MTEVKLKKCWICQESHPTGEFNDPAGHGYCSFCEDVGLGPTCVAIWNEAIQRALQCIVSELGPRTLPTDLLQEACRAVDESAGVSATVEALTASLRARVGALKRPAVSR